MARRIARSSVSASKPKNGRKRAQKGQKRNLDAFAIAEREVNDSPGIRKSRMGELEDDGSRRKRQRDDSDEDEEEDERPRHKKQSRDDPDISEGSDSEGNTWHTGYVEDDDDSEIDSDEAFGESDDERFADFTFRGSTTTNKKKKKTPKATDEDGDLDLEEGDDESGTDDDGESLGSEAVDLAQVLDDYEEKEQQEKIKGKKSRQYESGSDEDESDESESAGDDEASDYDMSDADEDDDDPEKVSELQNFISSISQDADANSKKGKTTNAHESAAPSEFGVGSSQKLDIGDLFAGTNDPNAKKLVKMLKDKKSSKRNGIPGKLDAPLPKRLQDKLDRQAANEKAKEQLERWVDTVKHNRRAEHISFPIKDPDAQEPAGVKHLVPLNNAKPTNELESTIQAIMEESGLATGGKNEEGQIREFEELQTNKLPLEEVLARRAELRKARDLLFREELRAKRVKKIKSKSWRRVHRKEREHHEQQEKEAMAAAGIDISEDEKERQDRRRAEERMGAKHRESKWAKGVKATGRAAWDDHARDGVNEMARKNEELRRRIEGKDVQDEDDMSDMSDEDDDESESGGAQRLQRQLNRISGQDSTEAGGLSKLASMKFMQRADAALKAQNDEDVKRIRKELAQADGESASDGEDDDGHQATGRRVFGPSSEKQTQPTKKQPRNEFEEEPGSDEEEASPIHADSQDLDQPRDRRSRKQTNVPEKKGHKAYGAVAREPSEDPDDNVLAAALSKVSKSKSKSRQGASVDAGPVLDVLESKSSKAAKPPKAKATESSASAESDGWTVVTYNNKETSEDEESDREPDNPFTLKKESLVEKAFAGDEVAEAFEAEKRAVEKDEGDKVIDNTLPGWGSWAGSGLSKKDRQRNSGRFLATQKGVKKEDRKDAKMKNVVINEKRVKKNSKYLASSLPFPHQSKQVYESTLRRPLGPEFNTKEIFQDGTKPRVMVKPGVVIKPLAKPLV